MSFKKKRAAAVLVSIIIELLLGYFIISHFLTLHKKVLSASIIRLDKKDLSFVFQDNLKFFYEPKPNSLDNNIRPDWLKEVPTYSINSDALREKINYSKEKSPDTYRIITLGDSFTYGLYVNAEDSYPKILEWLLNTQYNCSKYKKYEVINLGMPGYDIQYSVERFKVRGQKYNPDLVIWFLKADDFDQVAEFFYQRWVYYYNQTSLDKSTIPEKVAQEFAQTYDLSKLSDFQKKALFRLNNYYKNSLLIYSPKKNLPSADDQKIISDFQKSREGISFYNSELNLTSDNGSFPDGHPDKKGHREIAQDLYNYLKNNIICN